MEALTHGFSRLPVYLHCSANNRASAVLSLFVATTVEFGVPSRVRSDLGGENIEVARFMLEHPRRGPGRGSMITGRSVHNQRIERLWRDIFIGVLGLYYSWFSHLEEHGILDPANDIDLFCPHYVYLPQINRHLDTWKSGLSNHTLSGQSRTPLQLWTEGTLEMVGSGHTPALELAHQKHV